MHHKVRGRPFSPFFGAALARQSTTECHRNVLSPRHPSAFAIAPVGIRPLAAHERWCAPKVCARCLTHELANLGLRTL